VEFLARPQSSFHDMCLVCACKEKHGQSAGIPRELSAKGAKSVPSSFTSLLFRPFLRVVHFKHPISSIIFGLAEYLRLNFQLPREVLFPNGPLTYVPRKATEPCNGKSGTRKCLNFKRQGMSLRIKMVTHESQVDYLILCYYC